MTNIRKFRSKTSKSDLARKLLKQYLSPQHSDLYSPYSHSAIFLQGLGSKQQRGVIHAYSHVPIVPWYHWEQYLQEHDNFGWRTLVKPLQWDDVKLASWVDTNVFEYWWSPLFYATENFGLQSYVFVTNQMPDWSWTIRHGTKGHPTQQLQLHWDHESKRFPLSNNRQLPPAKRFPSNELSKPF